MGSILQSTAPLDSRLQTLFESAVVWDNHGCMPLNSTDATFLPQLQRYKAAGVDVVTLNVGYDALPWQETLAILQHHRRWILARPEEYQLVEKTEDIQFARNTKKLGVMFDIEGGNALNGDVSMVERYYGLGVRWMLMAYNRNNLLGGGCNDEDTGLTAFGCEVVREMERVGMVVCCTHTGLRTTLDVIERCVNPVIFSHSNPAGLWRHRRNISDAAIQACAATGGVVGINGIGIFLGNNDARSETIARHIDYVANLVGPEHVGIALDFVFDQAEMQAALDANPQLFPPQEYGGGAMALGSPEQIPAIAAELVRMGYDDAALRGILGGNHQRVAQRVWR